MDTLTTWEQQHSAQDLWLVRVFNTNPDDPRLTKSDRRKAKALLADLIATTTLTAT